MFSNVFFFFGRMIDCWFNKCFVLLSCEIGLENAHTEGWKINFIGFGQ